MAGMRVGVISDTHGLLRPEAVTALEGVDHILHTGDVGDPSILEELREIAPVTAIRGNIDRTGPCARLPATDVVELGGITFHMLHDVKDLDLDPRSAGIDVVVSGHSHQPGVERRKGVLFLNPGSAGPRRFSLPVTVARVTVGDGEVKAEIIELLSQ
ncbi:MAG TPA: metallophosphoesterase family protein [Acidobacteriaceae bacterium]|nr:metallophosphoesterase family protein [Acidobacteriaceae bacterium]